ncbi:MAG: NgoFVII family restriction endonuclease [Candidatus Stahlbacteria bacterium]|nr:NgoFVII family restriction endonuclease [Candidatus Stahlbacteria bacterium]
MKFKLFYPTQEEKSKQKYKKLLYGVSQASKLFSESKKPYIHYRTAENIFCKSFIAKNVGRKDCSVDAIKIDYGIGIKTFVSNGKLRFEKIAEFDDRKKYPLDYKDGSKLIKQIASYRNKRLETTVKDFGLDNVVYHYIIRDIGKIFIYECPMIPINEKLISIRKTRRASEHILNFNDKCYDYLFNLSKHTLYQGFLTINPLDIIELPTKIDNKSLTDALEELIGEEKSAESSLLETKEYVILPLYSIRMGEVPERSGLNQWHARGRPRDYDEVYIPIPIIVHKQKPGFFPGRDHKFRLKTEDGREFLAKICQENNKALMTDPNKDLGEWLLRDTLGLKKGEIATIEFLRGKNADTVIIYKLSENVYQIALHSFGRFEEEYKSI